MMCIMIIFVIPFEEVYGVEKVEFKLVKEWKFEKEIKDVAFGEDENGKLYPKIIVFEDEVKFYDEEGEVSQMKLSKGAAVVFSSNGKYIGIDRIVKSPPIDEPGDFEKCFILYDEKLKERAKIEYKMGYCGEGEYIFYPSDNGSFVAIDYMNQVLFLRDVNGKLKKKVVLFPNNEWSRLGVIFKYSKNEEYFAVLGVNIYQDPSRKWHHDFYVILFNSDGEEIWRRVIEKEPTHMSIVPEGLSISHNGNYVLAAAAHDPISSTRPLILFDKNGKLIGKYQGTSGEFSKDEKYVVIYSRNKIQLVQTQDGNIIWTKEFSWNIDSGQKRWRWFNEIEISEEGRLIGAISMGYRRIFYKTKYGDSACEQISENPEIILMDKNGNMVWQRREKTTKEKLTLNFYRNGEEIIITQKNCIKQMEAIYE